MMSSHSPFLDECNDLPAPERLLRETGKFIGGPPMPKSTLAWQWACQSTQGGDGTPPNSAPDTTFTLLVGLLDPGAQELLFLDDLVELLVQVFLAGIELGGTLIQRGLTRGDLRLDSGVFVVLVVDLHRRQIVVLVVRGGDVQRGVWGGMSHSVWILVPLPGIKAAPPQREHSTEPPGKSPCSEFCWVLHL